MKKYITLILHLVLLSNHSFCCDYVEEQLFFQKDTFLLNYTVVPLEVYLKSNHSIERKLSRQKMSTTGCDRGYIGSWKVEHDSLFLVGVTNCWDEPISMLKVFGTEKLFAYWYSGKIEGCTSGIYFEGESFTCIDFTLINGIRKE